VPLLLLASLGLYPTLRWLQLGFDFDSTASAIRPILTPHEINKVTVTWHIEIDCSGSVECWTNQFWKCNTLLLDCNAQ